MKKGENLQFLNIVWHNIIRNMYEKEKYDNNKKVKHAKNPAFLRISGFSLQNGYKLMQN